MRALEFVLETVALLARGGRSLQRSGLRAAFILIALPIAGCVGMQVPAPPVQPFQPFATFIAGVKAAQPAAFVGNRDSQCRVPPRSPK